MSRIDTRPIKFTTLTVRVPSTGVVRVPDGGYPHEFASIPNGWREIATASKYVVVPIDATRLRRDAVARSRRFPRT